MSWRPRNKRGTAHPVTRADEPTVLRHGQVETTNIPRIYPDSFASTQQHSPTVPKPVDFFLLLTLSTLMHSAMRAPELSMTWGNQTVVHTKDKDSGWSLTRAAHVETSLEADHGDGIGGEERRRGRGMVTLGTVSLSTSCVWWCSLSDDDELVESLNTTAYVEGRLFAGPGLPCGLTEAFC